MLLSPSQAKALHDAITEAYVLREKMASLDAFAVATKLCKAVMPCRVSRLDFGPGKAITPEQVILLYSDRTQFISSAMI